MIGIKPARYFDREQIDQMEKYELLELIVENGWEEDLHPGSTLEDWKQIPANDLRVMVDAKMNEYKQEIKRKVRYV